MSKIRTFLSVLTGMLLGLALGISFRNVVVGIITAICFSLLFYIINQHPKK